MFIIDIGSQLRLELKLEFLLFIKFFLGGERRTVGTVREVETWYWVFVTSCFLCAYRVSWRKFCFCYSFFLSGFVLFSFPLVFLLLGVGDGWMDR